MTDDAAIDDYFSAARVTGQAGPIELPQESYLGYLYEHDDPVLAGGRGMDYEEFTADKQSAPFLRDLLDYWDDLYREPFVGVTSDGVVREGLYALPGAPLSSDEPVLAAARHLLAELGSEEREAITYPIDAPEWRAWSNPEFVVYRVGVRLENLEPQKVDAVLELIRASLSPEGYERVREAMALNGYLGDLVDLPAILNERSYWFSIFGTPSEGGAWGWQLFGHHVAVHFITVAGRHVVAPVFLGAEPALSEGLRPPLFEGREKLAIELAESFDDAQRAHAVVYGSVLDPAMPEGRLHPADERHVVGAFRDNRVVPYEGIRVAELSERQQALLRRIVDDFLLLLVDPQRVATLRDYDAHLDETWFAWYGATDGSQPFYFRIQSPVIIAELDHHAGVWLSNRLPARFHVHTTLRLPNGNDYGRVYLAQARVGSRSQSTERVSAGEPDAESSAS